MELVSGGSGVYSVMFTCVVIVALHALLAFGTLSGVLLDASIIRDTGIAAEQVALGNSLVFVGWIPGALLGGPLGDRIGRKSASIAFALLASVGLCATGFVPEGNSVALLAARAMCGIGIGGFIAPSFTLLVETNDPQKKGQASVSWTWGYVAGVAILCAIHYGLANVAHASWRVEELTLGAWGIAFAAAAQILVTESPPYLLARGQTLEALESAGTIAEWNGVDLDEALRTEEALSCLVDALDACEIVDQEGAFLAQVCMRASSASPLLSSPLLSSPLLSSPLLPLLSSPLLSSPLLSSPLLSLLSSPLLCSPLLSSPRPRLASPRLASPLLSSPLLSSPLLSPPLLSFPLLFSPLRWFPFPSMRVVCYRLHAPGG